MPHDTEQPAKPAPSVSSWKRIPPFPRINRQHALINPQNLAQSICAGANCGGGGIEHMQTQEDADGLARKLEATGNYKVLRRLTRRPSTSVLTGSGEKIGIIVDFETTGLDVDRDEIIEVAMLKFSYSTCGAITSVLGAFESFNQPSALIPPEVVELTGISNEMVAGQKIDAAALIDFASAANIMIAHNAGFDRKFAERSWDVFRHRHWACSSTGIDWRRHGFAGTKLTYLLYDCGLFHGAHRALDDCHATLEILARPLPGTNETALAALLDQARVKTNSRLG